MRPMLETSIFAQHMRPIRPHMAVERRDGLLSASAPLAHGPIFSETTMPGINRLRSVPRQGMWLRQRQPEIKNICLKGIGDPNDSLSAHE
jgi:hypothetical protein